jgi:purine-nucleoside phosphorylase
MHQKINETAAFIKSVSKKSPETAIILGSGLGGLASIVDDPVELGYQDIPNFPVSTVAGHEGKLVVGTLNGTGVLVMNGRFHFYEGYSMREVTYPIFAMSALGIKRLIVSNAAGGINKTFKPGTLMLITDFINLMGTNPLIGKNDERFGVRFPDMSEPFCKVLRKMAKEVADKIGIEHRQGVYLATTGPYFETAAEVRMMGILGADAVGMSTVPETIVANYLGIDVLAISCITNMATGIADVPHSHEDVVKVANKTGENFCRWISEIVGNF